MEVFVLIIYLYLKFLMFIKKIINIFLKIFN